MDAVFSGVRSTRPDWHFPAHLTDLMAKTAPFHSGKIDGTAAALIQPLVDQKRSADVECHLREKGNQTATK
jgi:hypothetical protein